MRADAFVEQVRGGPTGSPALELGDRSPREMKERTLPEYLIMFNDEWVPEHTEEELVAKSRSVRPVIDEMEAAGVLVYSHGGLNRSTAVCGVEAVDGAPVFTDGPYVETKEHLGGFAVVDVADDDAARDWAGRLAVALDWPQEVHRFGPRRSPDGTAAGSGEG